MKRLFNLPTYVIIGLLSIYYFAIFLNLKSLLRAISGQAPLIVLALFACFFPIGLKGGMVFSNRNKVAFKVVVIFSMVVFVMFLILGFMKTDLSAFFSFIVRSEILIKFHKTIFGFISISVVYLFYFCFLPSIRIEEFIDSIKALPIASPIFCFGAPAFWTKSLLQFHLKASDISMLSTLSFFTGVVFLIALLLFYVAKNYNTSTSTFTNETSLQTKKSIYKVSLGLIFLSISFLLFVCIDLTYLIVLA